MTYRWGVIGLGRLATRKMIPAIDAAQNAELVAVATRTQAKLDEIKQERANLRTYAGWRDLLKDPGVDIVYLGTPNNLHAEMTIEAARNGKHVVCDKPMALNLDDAKRMVEACEQAGVYLGVLYHAMFNKANQAGREAMLAGKLGRLSFMRGRDSFSFGAQPPAGEWRLEMAQSGGGPLVDIGIYPLYIIRFLTGKRVRRVGAMSWNTRYTQIDVPDTSAAWIELEDGTPGTVDTSYTTSDVTRLELDGDTGRMEILNSFSTAPNGSLHLRTRGAVSDLTVEPDRLHHAESYIQLIQHFQESITNGTVPLNNGRAALADQAAIDAIHASAANNGCAVEVEME